jgi:hypothetical protein
MSGVVAPVAAVTMSVPLERKKGWRNMFYCEYKLVFYRIII